MLKLKLLEELDDLVQSQVEFDVGYFSGKQSKKHWLIGDDNLVQMYETSYEEQIKYILVVWSEDR